MARLGLFYIIGFGVPKDEAEGERLVQRAAQLGAPEGLTELGTAYATGQFGGQIDRQRAQACYFEASYRGDRAGRDHLEEFERLAEPGAKLYLDLGYLWEGNEAAWLAPTRVREKLAIVAGLGADNPLALVELGRAHLDGEFASRDYAVARTCFARAAAAGNREAVFFLAKMKLRGFGEPARRDEAMAAITTLADEGVGAAANYLGYLYYWGAKEVSGMKQDEQKAFAYARLAAEKGHPLALLNLGDCYESGIGTPKNYALAAKIFWQAYQRGYVRARERVRSDLAFVK